MVEDSERTVKQWDFVHMPPDVPHAVVGAGDRPVRSSWSEPARARSTRSAFPKSEAATRHGASAPDGATTRDEAYAGRGGLTPRDLFWPPPD